MTASMTVAPMTVEPNGYIDVACTGLVPKQRIKLRWGDTATSSSAGRASTKGTYGEQGIPAGAVTGARRLLAEQYLNGAWVEQASATVTVAVPAPPHVDDVQKAIDAAPVGSFLDLTGASFVGRIIVPKSLHVRGGSGIGTAGSRAYVVDLTGPDIELEGMSIVGGFVGISPRGLRDYVHDCAVTKVVYAGIMAMSAVSARISKNHVDGVSGSTADGPWNAYGITLTQASGGKPSTDCLVEGNLVEHVPVWHGLDTHAGVRAIFRGNTVRACRRAMALTSSPVDAIVDGNDLTCPTPAEQAAIPPGAPPTFGTDVRGIWQFGGTASITRNQGHGYPAGRWWTDGGGTHTSSGNIPAIP